MTNPLYYQWLETIARRDQVMLFIVLCVLTSIGVWYALREVGQDRRAFVWGAVIFFYASLVLLYVQR